MRWKNSTTCWPIRALAVIFDEAELAARREGWDAARWVRHLSAKLHRHDDVLPPGSGRADPDRRRAPAAAQRDDRRSVVLRRSRTRRRHARLAARPHPLARLAVAADRVLEGWPASPTKPVAWAAR
jgi:hypothetical protein